MEEMRVRVRWEGEPIWMNPDNLLLALRAYCPNTKFECEYLIHPKLKFDRGDILNLEYAEKVLTKHKHFFHTKGLRKIIKKIKEGK